MNLLRNKDFLFLFLGRIVTNIGDSFYYIAAMWLVYELGGNAFYSGLAGFLTLLPSALQFLTGPFVDRWRLRHTLVITQLLQFIIILIIPITYYFDLLTVQLLLIIMPIVSFIEQFAYPAQTKALPLLLQKTQLLKGNTLFSFAYQGIDIVCNAVAGVLVATVGAITLYIIDSFTFVIAALLFHLIKLPASEQITKNEEKSKTEAIKNYFTDLREGFSIVFHSLTKILLIGSIIANFSIGITMAILPSFADTKGGVQWYGMYLTAISAGSLIGALCGSLLRKYRLGHVSIISFTISSLCWLASVWIPIPSLAVLFFSFAWIPIGGTNIVFAALSQSVIPNHLLGRVNSVTRSMGIIAMPLGSLIGGYLATIVNSTFIFSFTSIGILCTAVVWLAHPKLRSLPKTDDITWETFQLYAKEEQKQGSVM
ncbi:MFS transporter [Bacillus manliponensis]|uniref:MFS transporter n=1 Tax=Bacillus manliponensis TaxID=574376 RepID=A0A073K6X3_9BACI|nr:MFS transporter [Bacillus manliponensis]KEK17983.1 MFS transporter [Bacillus manliponensis]